MSDSILTVVTRAPDRRLATAADVRAEMKLSGTPSDNELNGLIAQASDLIAGSCGGRVFGREALREIFRPVGPLQPLILRRDTVIAVTSIAADGVQLTADADFELEARSGLLYRLAGDARSPWRSRKITVEYSAGWLLPSQEGCDLPSDVRRVCIERVVRMLGARGRDPNIRSEGAQDVGQISFFDPNKLSDEERNALAPYKVHRL